MLPFQDVNMPSSPTDSELVGFDLGQDWLANVEPEDEMVGLDDESECQDENEDADRDSSVINEAQNIQATLTKIILNREIRPTGSSMDGFCHLVGQQPWVPFNLDKKDPIFIEDHEVFMRLHTKYNRKAQPSAKDGYRKFEEEWNTKAGVRYCQSIRGEEVTLLFRKTIT